MILRWARKYTRKTDGQPDLFTFAIPIECGPVMKDVLKILLANFKKEYPNYDLTPPKKEENESKNE